MRRLGIVLFFVLSAVLSGGIYYFLNTPKILVTMTSTEKPIFASSQILRMMNQTYSNIRFNVSIKGMSDFADYRIFSPEWRQYSDKKRLRVRRDKDKTPFLNWLDTMADTSLDQYDIVCLIKDENWYDPTYLETIARHFDPSHYDLLSVPDFLSVKWHTKTVGFEKTKAFHTDGNMCFTPKLVHQMVRLGQNEHALKRLLPKAYHGFLKQVSPEIIAWYLALKKNRIGVLNTPIPLMIQDENIPVFSSY